jgi:predicted nucleotidyltransferase
VVGVQWAKRSNAAERTISLGHHPCPFVTPTDARALEAFADRVRTALGDRLLELRLFGSKARGDSTPESDIDILVIVSGDSERWRLAMAVTDIAFSVNLEHDVFISPVVVSEAVRRDPVWHETPFARSAYHDGLPFVNDPAVTIARRRLE